GQQRAGVAGRDDALDDGVADLLWRIEQAQRVGDGRAALTDASRDLLLGQPELPDELAISQGLLNRVEVGSLDVLDEGDLQRLHSRDLANDDRHLGQAGGDGRPPAALAGDDLVGLLADRTGDDQRLDDAVLADGGGQFFEPRGVPLGARLEGVGLQVADRDGGNAGGIAGGAGDQRV